MRFAIKTGDENCPFGAPVSVTDTKTGMVVGCHKTVVDAHKQKALLEGSDMTSNPDLFARGASCPCCAPEQRDCAAGCSGCDCMRAKRVVEPPLIMLPPTVAW